MWMRSDGRPVTIPSVPTDSEFLALPSPARRRRALLVVDVVESVRLFREFEDDVVVRWPRFVRHVRSALLPARRGIMVKSIGDGMLLGFECASDACQCALDLQTAITPFNASSRAESTIWLRVGLHVGEVVCEDFDWFGSAVNVCARVVALADPGGCVATAEFRDQLTPGLDADFEDLGECFLKHLPEPQRCYRMRPVQSPLCSETMARPGGVSLGLTTIAVVPFEGQPSSTRPPAELDGESAFGDALAESLISALSGRRDWRVLAMSSTRGFRGRAIGSALHTTLGATYSLTGRYALRDQAAEVVVSLRDERRDAPLWEEAFRVAVAELFSGEARFVPEVVGATARVISDHEVRFASALPLPNLDDYALYAGGLTLMHRLAVADFNRARDLFELLQDRAPRAASPSAMLARWHLLSVTQGWSRDRTAQVAQAHAAARRALDLEPAQAYALCVDGLRRVHAEHDLDGAARRYLQALDRDPQEPTAWSWLAGVHAYRDEGDAAVLAAHRAIALSPLDPLRFSMDSYLALAMLVAGRYEECIDACRSAIHRNCLFGASYRTLAQALALAGRHADAREAMQRLLVIEPGSTVRSYRRVYPGRDAAHMDRFVDALRIAGLPE